MNDFIVTPSASVPTAAAAARPGKARSGEAQGASFEEAIQAAEQPEPRRPRREAELAAASQAAAQAQAPVPQPETPPVIETPPDEGEGTVAVGEAAQNPAFLQAAAMLTGQPAVPAAPSLDVTGTPLEADVPAEPQPVAPAPDLVQSGAEVKLSQANLDRLDGIPTEGLAEEMQTSQGSGAGFQAALEANEKLQQIAADPKSPAAKNDGLEVTVEREETPVQAPKIEARSEQPASGPAVPELAGAKVSASGVLMSEPARLSEARSGETLRQIASAIDHLNRAGQGSLRLQLNPQDLGRIDLRLANSPDGLRVWIQADQPATSRMLEANLKDLRQSLSDLGVQLSQVSVGQQGAHGSSWQGQTHQQAGRPRPYSPQNEALDVEALDAPADRTSQSLVDYQA